jgi:hypothetical protein
MERQSRIHLEAGSWDISVSFEMSVRHPCRIIFQAPLTNIVQRLLPTFAPAGLG